MGLKAFKRASYSKDDTLETEKSQTNPLREKLQDVGDGQSDLVLATVGKSHLLPGWKVSQEVMASL